MVDARVAKVTLKLYSIFLVVAIVIMVTPGPAVVLAITNGILHGVRGALFAIFGNMTGLVILTAISSLGLGAVISTNDWLFDLLKWLGGLYLVYLGVMMWRTDKSRIGVSVQIDSVKSLTHGQLYQRGLMVTASNPKAIIFVTALLPQFIQPQQPLIPQFAILIGTMLAMQLLVLGSYALLANQIRHWLNYGGRIKLLHRIIGSCFVGFGILLAFSQQR
ncbi:MAG: homoserine/homoserine lactone efflux protein [Planctomycetota bacterium]